MTTFEVWAPNHDRVRLRALGSDHEMAPVGDGVAGHGPGRRPGTDYGFLLDDDDDPAARPARRAGSRTGCTARAASTTTHGVRLGRRRLARPRSWPASVIYELHVGTFTPEGTFDAAIDRLDHLVELGVDLVELMPVNAVNGDAQLGLRRRRPGTRCTSRTAARTGSSAFVDACHQRGLGVVLDVVYNHLGPSGATTCRGSGRTSSRAGTTWGDLVNLDGPGAGEVRRYIIDNALMWLRDYHVDGLRLDAVHALVDDSAPRTCSRELAARGRRAVRRTCAGRSR